MENSNPDTISNRNAPGDILVVDDTLETLRVIEAILKERGHRVRCVADPETALVAAANQPPELMLLDVIMPGMSGYEVCRKLKAQPETAEFPIIFLTSLTEMENLTEGFQAGGVAFLSKPVRSEELLAYVGTHLELHRAHQTIRTHAEQLEQRVAERTAELQEAVRQLRESKERYELAISGSSAGIWDWDILADRVYYSDRFKELMGYAPHEISDELDEFWNRLHPDDGEAVKLALDRHLKERAPYVLDYRLRTGSGEYKWFHARGHAQWNEGGTATRVSGSIIDITARIEAEAELRSSEERFRTLMEQSPLAIEMLTPEGRISQVNAAWRRMWNVSEEETLQVLEQYNMLTDKRILDRGMAPLVEKAFAGEDVDLPAFEYDTPRTVAEMGLPHIKPLSPWIQCHLYAVKDEKGEILYVVNTYVDITETKKAEIKLQHAFDEIKDLKDQLEAESAYLQEEIRLEHNYENIIGRSETLKYVMHRVEQVAATDSPVLITGETGTGKELIARTLHELSPQGKRPLVKVNCAALPGELIESELFGREKGAFTGATSTEIGRFELARGTTLFLDEIGEMPPTLQAKLLRVLESGEFERLGSSKTRHSDARVIAATNRILEEEVQVGHFRKDLWYRLKVFQITAPPLRERPEDIPLLVKWFMDDISKRTGRPVAEIPKRTMQQLLSYPWPGNVRELKHAVESAMITSQGGKLRFELPETELSIPSDFRPFEEMEHDYILQVLKARNWKIGGPNSAASTLGMHVNTLRGRMKKLGIKKSMPE